MGIINSIFGSYSKRELKKIAPITQLVLDMESEVQALSDKQLKSKTADFKERLSKGETLDDILVEAFAVCREVSWRVLNMKHFPVQVTGGIILHQGRIAEMKTGEGKTLVATLPVYLNALSGQGVHVVTVNEYLATRDAEWMGKVYKFLGLSVGVILSGMKKEDKKAAYACDVCYGTNNEIGFDYLRDNMAIYKESRIQRGFIFAIVDEVDSILIDEARTPLIISGQGTKSTEAYKNVNSFIKRLEMVKVAELDSKEDHEYLGGDFIVDEKAKTATLTARGIKKAEQAFSVENINSVDNMQLLHHINQAIKAHGTMKRDVNYIVREGEVIIVDEFTGRLMIGRRYSEGLHQAIEAKENVRVARESKTLATITFQNLFRMYKKLAGMTGTAVTEEVEFQDIYGLDVVEVPTNMPIVREDRPDAIYKTEKGKLSQVVERVMECNAKGQPILVGTADIENSEKISKLLKAKKIKHNVLNAKQHEREAEIVAQAGKIGAVTIATNMAGRGTDIVLGGNPEFLAKNDMRAQEYEEEQIEAATAYFETEDKDILASRDKYKELYSEHKKITAVEAEKVKAAGGLAILGTERHEARRIDNQLRGRSGRQGDSGESQFYISLEDDLMRLFGSEKAQTIMNVLKVEEDMPIENGVLSNSIEGAQKNLEGRNYQIRKSVLSFDEVMNKQREIIYGQRSQVLEGADMKDYIERLIKESVTDTVATYINKAAFKEEWNILGLKDHYLGFLTTESDLEYTTSELNKVDYEDIEEFLVSKAMDIYSSRESEHGDKVMRELERVILLKNVDMKWMDHIDAMDQLKKGIYLRSYGQKDPVVEYRIEGFDMFDDMIASIKDDTAKMVLTARINKGESVKREQVAKPSAPVIEGTKKPIKTGKKIGRNDPCPCGSGKKYKKCCGA